VNEMCFVKKGSKSKVFESESDFNRSHESILLAQRALYILL
jgi:hypothetical protein